MLSIENSNNKIILSIWCVLVVSRHTARDWTKQMPLRQTMECYSTLHRPIRCTNKATTTKKIIFTFCRFFNFVRFQITLRSCWYNFIRIFPIISIQKMQSKIPKNAIQIHSVTVHRTFYTETQCSYFSFDSLDSPYLHVLFEFSFYPMQLSSNWIWNSNLFSKIENAKLFFAWENFIDLFVHFVCFRLTWDVHFVRAIADVMKCHLCRPSTDIHIQNDVSHVAVSL